MTTWNSIEATAGHALALAPTAAGELKFPAGDGFYAELRRRVDRYFGSSGVSPRDRPQMYLKTAVLVAWFAAS